MEQVKEKNADNKKKVENKQVEKEVKKEEKAENKQVEKKNKKEEKAENKQVEKEVKKEEKAENKQVEKKVKKEEIKEEKNKKSGIFSIFIILVLIFITILLIICVAFTYINMNNTKIFGGIYIKGVDVSNLSKEEAENKLNAFFDENIPDEIVLKSSDYEAAIPSSALGINFNLDDAINTAYSIGRDNNIFVNDWQIIQANIKKMNVEPVIKIDEEQLKKYLEEISSNLPDTVIESSYYIEDNNLIITNGKVGNVVDIDSMIPYIENKIENLEVNNEYLEIAKISKDPAPIDLDNIYNEVHKEAKDAYYTQNPFSVFPSENGLDFDISIEDAKSMLEEEKEEYIIPLKVLYPNITTNMIGTEAFPDLLSTFSTNYQASNWNRTTNLILAANKINGTVLMPGEVFSYNKVVGERTIAAGYKEAPIYVSGKVEDGLGGGICQITTTLYNAVVYANLEIVERTNHQFVPSYVGASRDATVVYGAIDFKFKNNRDYPIKIMCTVSGGVANFQIFGLKTDNDYDVEISTRITSSTANAIYSQAYKTLKKDGQVISTEVLSNDTYKKH